MKNYYLLAALFFLSIHAFGQTCKVSLTKKDISCNSACDGSVTASMTGAKTYSWNTTPVQTTATIRNLCPGTYKVIVTDTKGCTSTDSVAVVQPPAITIATGSKPSACGQSTGSAFAKASGGASPYTYSWNTNPIQNTDTAKALPAGTYTVTVTDISRCIKMASVTLNNSNGPILSPSSTNVSCFGGSNGSASVTVSGGVGPYTYAWNTTPVQTTSTITGLIAGTYSVVVTASNNCTATTNFTITEPSALTINRTRATLLCFGATNGTLTAAVTGGTGRYSYSWSTNPVQTTATATGLAAGNYTVTVTDSNSCSASRSFRVTQPAQIAISNTITNSTCGQATGQVKATVTGGTPPYTYSWNTTPAQTTATITGLLAGSYTLTVTDANSCTQTAIADVSNSNGPIPTTTSTNVSCTGTNDGTATVSVTGGTAPYAYSWDTNPIQTTASISGLAPGDYTVKVTDYTGCTGFAGVKILPALFINTTQNNITGCNGNLGSATAFASGGTAPYTYSWNTTPIQGNARARNLVAGTYTVTVTDASGCVKTKDVTITQPTPMKLTTSVVNSKCNQAVGQATVTVTGGSGAYSYLWNSAPTQNTATATALTAGIYTVTVNDNSGCNANATVTINNSDGPVPAITSTNVSCFGGNNGTASASVTGGVAPYTYSWNTNPAQTTSAIAGLTTGTYSVTITDKTGCVAVASAIITSPNALNIFRAQTNVTCFGGSDGSATATVSGGKAPYTYSWTNSTQTTFKISNLSAGNYSVTVTDTNACQLIRNYRIGQPPVIAVAFNISNSACGQATGQVNATVSGGTGPYTYSWNTNPSQTTATATGLAAGSYALSVTDASGCKQTAVANVGNLNGPALTVTSTNISCTGTNDGTATVTASGGTPPYTYSWNSNPVQTSAKAIGLPAGNYSVTVTDNAACISIASTVVGPALSATVTQRNVTTCNGGSNGSATTLASGGTGPYNYSWNTNPVRTTATINRIPAGTYTVTITDVTGCVVTKSVTILQPNPIVLSTTTVNSSCTSPTGQASVTATGGITPYNYSWNTNPVQSTSAVMNLAPGAYTVTVVDRNNCTQTANVNINTTNGPVVTASSTNVSCNGGNNGTATAQVTGGKTPYTYSWNSNPVQTISTATGLASGSYSVLVTDTLGCQGSATTTVTQPPALRIVRNIVNVTCNGGSNGMASVKVSGGTAPYTYAWNTNPVQTTDSIKNLKAGNYSVLITDKNGCSNTFALNVRQPASIVATTSTVASGCGAATGQVSVNVTGGIFPYTYSWNTTPVQTTATITNLKAGVYTVTITDANACTQTASASVGNTNGPALTTSSTNVSCSGGATGTAFVNATGGQTPYSYSWNTNPVQTTAQVTGLAAGTYSVSVTDNLGCISIASVTINPTVSTTTRQVNLTCNGGTNGSASALPANGTAPYTYLWNTNPAQTTATATQLKAGSYMVTVTDAKSCSTTASVLITEPAAIVLKTSATATACGQSNGTVSVTASGGTPGYTYSWNTTPAQNTATASGLPAGAYIVTVNDRRGCTQTATSDVNNTGGPALTGTATKVTCNGGADGTATVAATGGTAPYTYSWSTNPVQTTIKATGLIAGSYAVTVSDNGSCKGVINIVVTEPALLKITTTQKNVLCNGGTNGTLSAMASGGTGSTGAYTYSWNTNPVQTTASITNLKAGQYTVTVKDSLGCTSSTTATITEPGIITATATKNNVSCFGGSNGSLNITAVSGGTPGFSYSWNTTPVQTQSNAINLKAGSYSVTIKDTNACTNTNTFTITEPALLKVTFSQTNVSCNGGNNGSATAATTGGTGPVTFVWNTNPVQTTATLTNLKAGTYTVTAKDSMGCTGTGSVTILEAPILSLTTSVVNTSCGSSLGSVTVSASGGNPAYTYSWNTTPVQKTATASNLPAGAYTVTVVDAKSCSQTATANVNTTNGPQVTSGGKNNTCNGAASGLAFANATGGTAPYAYSWNTNPVLTTDTIKNLKAGTYTTTITDKAGCKGFASVVVTQPAAIKTTVTVTNVSCNKGTDGTLSANATGGTPGYSYNWNTTPIQKTAKITNLTAGTYFLLVMDTIGCKDTSSYKVTEPAAIVANTIITAPKCNGGSDGAIALNVTGGSGPYSYLWNTTPVQTTSSISNLKAGTYTVKITDAASCSTNQTIALTEPAVLNSTIVKNDISCYGGSNGTATVTVTGGTPVYKYQWNTSPLQKSATATGLIAKTYIVNITDGNSCIKTDSVTISMPDSLSGTITKNNPVCNAGTDGSISISMLGGLPPYSYSWNTTPAQTTASATALKAGNYTVTVKDANGCQYQKTTTLTEPTAVVVTTSQKNVVVNGGSNGSAFATASGGTPGYSYSWSTQPVQTTARASNLNAGSYTITVTDNIGCTGTKTITITEPAVLSDSIQKTDVSCAGLNDGKATATAYGGIPPYRYFWNTNPAKTSASINGLIAGTYTVTILDSAATSITTDVVIKNPAPATITGKTAVCLGDSVVLTASPGTAYLWSTGAVTPSIKVSPIKVTQYVVKVNNGTCADSAFIQVIIDRIPVIFIVGKTSICQGQSTTLTASGGSSYLWNTKDTTATINVTPSNTKYYSVKVSNSCSFKKDSSQVIVNPKPVVNLGKDTLIYQGQTIQLITKGGEGVYQWTPATDLSCTDCNAPLANPSENTAYALTVTSAKGCVTTAGIKVNIDKSNVVYVPNIFSPNGDGENDQLFVRGKGIRSIQLFVYDRWGVKVFETSDQNKGWDGTMNGALLNTAVYVYYLDVVFYNNVKITQKGDVTLLR
jgi:gliding motility-associated-like protein